MRRDSLFWGVFLVLLGGLFLLENLGFFPAGINVWGIFWPLVLIGLGVGALIRATGGGSARSVTMRLPQEQSRRAWIKINYGAGELCIDDRAAPGELFTGTFDGGLEHSVRRLGDEAEIEMRLPSDHWPFAWPFMGTNHLNWTVGLSPEIPLRLDLELGASRNILELTELQVKELRLSTEASATTIDFPARAGQTKAWLKSGAASVDVNIPMGVAASIRTRGGLARFNVDTARFPRSGDSYQSVDFASAENRLDLDVETRVGSVSIR